MPELSLTSANLVALSPRALHTLRDRVGATALQEAGYAAGDGTYQAFCSWLHGTEGIDDPREVAVPVLAEVLTRFFSSLGWGSVQVTMLNEATFAVDSGDWAEAQAGAGLQYPACSFTSGVLADFFTRYADAALAVMEVECRSRGDGHCRWLVGSPETLTMLYQYMAQGADYRTILQGG